MKHNARRAACDLVLPLLGLACAGTAAAQGLPSEIRVGVVRVIDPSSEDQRFTLRLREGDGVIVDLVPLRPAETAGATPSNVPTEDQQDSAVVEAAEFAADAAAVPLDGPAAVGSRVLSIQVLGATGCIRSIPTREGCPAGVSLTDIEYQAESGALRLALRPPTTGRYTLVVSAPEEIGLSGYELLVRRRGLPEPIEPAEVEICDAPKVKGSEDSCARTYALGSAGQAHFVFETTKPNQGVQIEMASEKLDGALTLSGPLGNGTLEDASFLASDDDSGGNLDPLLRERLALPGRYVVTASAFSVAGASFTLAVRDLGNPTPRPTIALKLGEEWRDEFDGNQILPYHRYTLAGAAGDIVVVDMTSDRLDTTLEAGVSAIAVDESSPTPDNFARVAFADDSCGRNPQLRLRFESAGTIALRAGFLGPVTSKGGYTIVARKGPATCASSPSAS